ncbi:penicillin acylase family protein [Pseudidiomarina halophila]|uniref:penicillin acylase family protein n=1 Tax=Pseudidiomarina halophila TaxID=1449799 RepID=UPI003606ACF3
MPHIYADETYGLFYGYGYAVAQDRLFQIEMIRRSAMGTVAEVLGRTISPSTRKSAPPMTCVRSRPRLRPCPRTPRYP